ncbi:hypothetical protein S40288_11039 [Stachybotrys chartarum IBT 40288]|nr:hypothetical protein S40288_11039 [Stachybotrys chartarum IBT 40288]
MIHDFVDYRRLGKTCSNRHRRPRINANSLISCNIRQFETTNATINARLSISTDVRGVSETVQGFVVVGTPDLRQLADLINGYGDLTQRSAAQTQTWQASEVGQTATTPALKTVAAFNGDATINIGDEGTSTGGLESTPPIYAVRKRDTGGRQMIPGDVDEGGTFSMEQDGVARSLLAIDIGSGFAGVARKRASQDSAAFIGECDQSGALNGKGAIHSAVGKLRLAQCATIIMRAYRLPPNKPPVCICTEWCLVNSHRRNVSDSWCCGFEAARWTTR